MPEQVVQRESSAGCIQRLLMFSSGGGEKKKRALKRVLRLLCLDRNDLEQEKRCGRLAVEVLNPTAAG